MKLTNSHRAYTRQDCTVADFTCACETCNEARRVAARGGHVILVVPPCKFHDRIFTAMVAREYPGVQLIEQQQFALQ